ncbi:response regulator transcription factor [bacterium]|nr:response regulator transcription factor [bacterium]
MISLLREHFKDVEVGEAEDAKTGLAAALNETWDLAIIDITMPGRNGLELIQEIKLENTVLPILVVSSHPEKDYALRALKLGAAGYVSKQSAADVLVTAVQRVMSGRRFISPALAEQLAGALAGEAPGTSHETLSNRELQVLRQIALGKTIKEISFDLALSAKTVATYRSRIAEKMGLASNVELTRYAMQNHLVD